MEGAKICVSVTVIERTTNCVSVTYSNGRGHKLYIVTDSDASCGSVIRCREKGLENYAWNLALDENSKVSVTYS